jgi:uncharacterized protein (UPF0548 family)
MTGFSYAEVGASRFQDVPAGYNVLRYRVRLGDEREVDFAAAADAVLTFAVQRAAGVRMDTTAAQAAEGVRVTSGLGLGRVRLDAPCTVVWTVREPGRAGFAYGTLPGHPMRGEESFLVERDGSDVYFRMFAFSRPAVWYTRVTGPIVVLLQHAYARLLGFTLRRLARRRAAVTAR